MPCITQTTISPQDANHNYSVCKLLSFMFSISLRAKDVCGAEECLCMVVCLRNGHKYAFFFFFFFVQGDE